LVRYFHEHEVRFSIVNFKKQTRVFHSTLRGSSLDCARTNVEDAVDAIAGRLHANGHPPGVRVVITPARAAPQQGH